MTGFHALARPNMQAGRHVCVGLDPVLERLPPSLAAGQPPAARLVAFGAAIVDATADLAAAYKPNTAFYEAHGAAGVDALHQTVDHIRRRAPDVPVILDAKRADIASTNDGYVTAAFDALGAHAITLHPYLGREALEPFLARADRVSFVLVRTSNPGGGELQELVVDGLPLYRHVARAVAGPWNARGNCGLVVGATRPAELAAVRDDVGPDVPILIPGVGAQGGDLEATVVAASGRGSDAFLISVSRTILYASSGPDFPDAARAELQRLDAAILAAAV